MPKGLDVTIMDANITFKIDQNNGIGQLIKNLALP
jgi:hypothetical protein